MPITKSQLDYWSGSAWVTAETPSNKNALIRFTLDEKMGQASACTVKVTNKFNNPFSDEEADYKGNLSGVFTDFQRIRVVDRSTKSVLFYGRIYETIEKYDLMYGNVIEIEALDALAELKDIVTDGHEDINLTTSGDTFPTIASPTTAVGKRSGLIKGLLSLFAKTGNFSFTGDANRFNESEVTFTKAGKYALKSGGWKSVLSHVNGAAKSDAHSSTKKVLTYDYYVDPNFQSRATDHEPAAFFNYFKRGDRPVSSAISGTSIANHALRVVYPTGGGLARTGRIVPMMADYDFNRPKSELYTDVICHYIDEGPDTVGGATNKDKGWDIQEKQTKIELVKVKSISGSFVWAGKMIGGGVAGTDSAEEVKSGSTVVGRIQFISATSGGSDSSPEYALISDATSAFPSSGTITGATSTSSSFQIVSRNSDAYGINKTARLGATNVENSDSVRDEAVAKLRRSSDSIIRGRVRIMSKPWFYVASSNTTVSGNTITFSDLAPLSYGFRIGMTVNKVTSTGVVQSYGYATAVTQNSVTVGGGMSSTVSTGDIIRLYIPVRASDSCYIINRLVAITGGEFQITEVHYIEENGIVSTELEMVGTDSGLGPPQNTVSRLITAVNETANPKASTGTAQSAKVKLTCKFSQGTLATPPINKHTTISWDAGQLTVGANAYSITASTQVFGSTGEHYLYYDTEGGTAGFNTSTVAAYTTDKNHALVCWVNIRSTSNSEQWLEFKSIVDLNTSVPDKGMASSTINERTISPTDKLTTAESNYLNAEVAFKSAGLTISVHNTSGSVTSSFPINFADGTSVTITGYANSPFVTLGSTSGTSSNEATDNYIYADTSNTSLNITTTPATAIGNTKIILATVVAVSGGDAIIIGRDSAASSDLKRLNKAIDSSVEFVRNFELNTNDTYLKASPIISFGVNMPHGGGTFTGTKFAQGAANTEQSILFQPTLTSATVHGYIQSGVSGVSEDDMIVASNSDLWLNSFSRNINVSHTDKSSYCTLNMLADGRIRWYGTTNYVQIAISDVSGGSASSYNIYLPDVGPGSGGGKILQTTTNLSGQALEWATAVALTGTNTWTGQTTFSFSSNNSPAIWLSAAPARFDEGFWLENEGTPGTPDSSYIRVYSEGEVLKYRKSSGAVITLDGSSGASLSGTNTWTGVNTYTNDVIFNEDVTLGNSSFDLLTVDACIDNGTASSPGLRFLTDGTRNTSAVGGIYWEAGSGSVKRIRFPCFGTSDSPYFYMNSSTNTGVVSDEAYHTFFKAPSTAGVVAYTFSDNTNTGMHRNPTSNDVDISGNLVLSKDDQSKLEITHDTNRNLNHVMIEEMDLISSSVGTYIKWDYSSSDSSMPRTKYLMESTSTRRHKMDIQDIIIDTSKIYDLQARSFHWRKYEKGENGEVTFFDIPRGDLCIGMIAEEVYEHIPEVVSIEYPAKIPRSIDYPLLSVLIIEELKKLRSRIEVLEGN